MADYVDLLKRPFQDWKSLLIGTLLYIIPIINFFAVGFGVEAARMAITGKKGTPAFENWGGLFVQGLMVFLIVIIWLIPILILGGIFGLGSLATGIQQGGLAALATLGLGLVITSLVTLVIAYFIMAAIINYVAHDNFGAAFALGDIFKVALTGPYFMAWIISFLLSAVLLGAAGAFTAGFGQIIVVFLIMYWSMLLVGNAYREVA